MKSSEVIQALKSSINATKEAGIKSISIDELAAYASRLEVDVNKTPDNIAAGDAAMEAYKADLNSWMLSRQQRHENNLEMLRATITTGQSALKSALLINGGASIAMLAFIGKVWNNTTSQVIEQLSGSLTCFVFGVLAAAMSAGFTYLSQAGYGDEFGKISNKIAVTFHALTIMSVLFSYFLFVQGALVANNTFVSQ